jgi:ABC-2 type transport system permease protein
MAWAQAIATGLGFAVGFRPGGSARGILAAFGLCLVFGLAFEWVFIAGGLVAGNAQAAQSMIGLAVTPLVFLSSAYVPVQSMPNVVRQFSEVQPLTPMADAVRSLLAGADGRALVEHSTSYYIGLSLLWAAAIFVVFGFLAVVRFARR